MAESWWLYMIECRGGGIYTGIAKDVQARYEQHAKGKGAKYTKMNPPIRLLGQVEFLSHKEAASEEWKIKRLTRAEKLNLLSSLYHTDSDEGSLLRIPNGT
ncbi:MAG: GIY-YIG nuclease family protein [Geobacter sp.]|nr:GIY-YIG nuclease family protein [Geobacter sp.]